MTDKAISNFILGFLLRKCNQDEKQSYIQYIKYNDFSQTLWITKMAKQRDAILCLNLKCECDTYIHINEKGNAYCDNHHPCKKIVYQVINDLYL